MVRSDQDITTVEELQLASLAGLELGCLHELVESWDLLEEPSLDLLALLGLTSDDASDLAIASPVDQGVDEGLGIVAGGKTSSVLVGGMNITFQNLLGIVTVVVRRHVVSKAPKLDAAQVTSNLHPPLGGWTEQSSA